MRDDIIHGEALVEPTLGRSFYMRGQVRDGEPTTALDCRMINTSPLVKVEGTMNGWLLTTQSGSKYFLGKVND